MKRPSATLGLYLHVPFCVRKCAYCDFASRPIADGGVERYLSALERELALRPADFAPSTVYIGGGTPTALPDDALARALALVRAAIAPERVVEWTCEANPGTLTASKARILRAAGVNRISLGAQSFDDARLRHIGRIHTAAEIREAVAVARGEGFANLSLDLMYGLPGESCSDWQRDLDEAIALQPEHISLYALAIEDGTPFARERDAGRLAEADEEEFRAQYERARATLAAAGYGQYEISNFARPGRECRHNLLYWSGGEYLGFGPAAHSHWRGARRGNFQGLEDWAAAVSKAWKADGRDGAPPPGPASAIEREFEERLDPEAKARETLVFGLRRLSGWRRSEFRARTGFDYRDLRGPEIERLASDGRLVDTGECLRLAEDHLFVSDAVFRELI